MRKINARLEPANEKELGVNLGKQFECENCAYTKYFRHAEFGEIKSCPKCGNEMFEIIEDL